MKSAYRYILYSVVIVIIAGGLALFFLRNKAVELLSANTGMTNLEITPRKTLTTAKNALDISIFTAPKFIALKNNVATFDFDSICKTPVGQVEVSATAESGEISTSTEPLRCSLGNSTLFPLPAKNK